jgi:hypothetical protein
MEYVATVTVNPLTVLRMLQDFVKLICWCSFVLSPTIATSPLALATYIIRTPPLPLTLNNLYSQVMPLSRMVPPVLSVNALFSSPKYKEFTPSTL